MSGNKKRLPDLAVGRFRDSKTPTVFKAMADYIHPSYGLLVDSKKITPARHKITSKIWHKKFPH